MIMNLQMDLRFKLYCSHHWAQPHYHWVTGTITWEIARKISSDSSYTQLLSHSGPQPVLAIRVFNSEHPDQYTPVHCAARYTPVHCGPF